MNDSPTRSAFSHLDAQGQVRMVDVGAKAVVQRVARAEGFVRMQVETVQAIARQSLPKGDVFAVARIAGIQAAKRTSEWVPLCHTLPLDQVSVSFSPQPDGIRIETEARCSARTGVEMEALVAVSAAALSVYDLCKAIDSTMTIESIRVTEKHKKQPET